MTVKPSDVNPRSAIVNPLAPQNNSDLGPTHYSDFGFGGLRTVDNQSDRFDIPSSRRVVGMVVYQTDVNLYFKLEGGLTDNDWVVWSSTFKQTFNTTTDWTEIGSGTGNFQITFSHNLASDNVEYVIYDSDNNFVFTCVSSPNQNDLIITVNNPVTRFAGRITINREG